jgi:hypothetical protein
MKFLQNKKDCLDAALNEEYQHKGVERMISEINEVIPFETSYDHFLGATIKIYAIHLRFYCNKTIP